jgi:hypothetical protein
MFLLSRLDGGMAVEDALDVAFIACGRVRADGAMCYAGRFYGLKPAFI